MEDKMGIFNKIVEGFANIFDKKPIIKENTFLLWEPCSKSHSEVLPGFAKYLIDLGYHVSVLTNSKNFKDGLFCKYKEENISYNNMSKRQVRKYFKNTDLSDVKGLLVTTVGKLCDSIHYDDSYSWFNEKADKSKIYFVEHEIMGSADFGTWDEKIITLRKMDYKGVKSVVVNPHYFGEIKVLPKNEVTNFVTIGALRGKRKNTSIIVDAVEELVNKGIANFKVTVIGKGKINDLPKSLHKYIDIKGRLPFYKMYEELEKADFILSAYDEDNPAHKRYITTGTSGNFQLVYGFLKPCVIMSSFAEINDFTNENSILYENKTEYADAMQRAIQMSKNDYEIMQNNLRETVKIIYENSKNNLKERING